MQEAKRRKPQSSNEEASNNGADDSFKIYPKGGALWIAHVMLTCLLVVLYVRERDARITVEGLNERLNNEGITLIDQLRTAKTQLEQKPRCPDCPICKVCPPTPKCPACAKCPPTEPKAAVKDNHKALEHKLEIWKERHTTLTKALKKTSKEILATKYGKEPYIVELHVELPEGQDGGVITVEMAPASLVPHAVLYFLSQVSAGAWNGCSFIRNAHHVLQADPRGKNCDRKKFRNLDTVEYSIPFQEYHQDFPHKALTLGLAGRPGGPDFYISTVDNTANHGPGGQGSYEVSEEADSCFGKVIGGEDVVARMRKLSVLPGSFNELKSLVTITEAKIIPQAVTADKSNEVATVSS